MTTHGSPATTLVPLTRQLQPLRSYYNTLVPLVTQLGDLQVTRAENLVFTVFGGEPGPVAIET
jgi:hypothetical protein